ncbi:Uncharacterized protein HZ326_0141 [Fusarium oxysporum f. sp. albedinis]|nr:Uncharacterized protein HZ326_0141 [Fusarium oxysporum f. sp. albedinis]
MRRPFIVYLIDISPETNDTAEAGFHVVSAARQLSSSSEDPLPPPNVGWTHGLDSTTSPLLKALPTLPEAHHP